VQAWDDAVALLARHAARPPAPHAAPEPIAPCEPGAVAAVDGSSAVLVDNGTVWAVAVRAAAVHWPGADRAEVPVLFHAALASEGADQAARAYAAAGLEAPRVHGAEGYAEAYRTLAELDTARAAIDALPPGGLLLVDGALHQLPRHAQAVADRILALAAARQVAVLGVAKRSGLVPPGLDGPRSPWRVPLAQGIQVCRLHGASRHRFRIDGDAGALGRLLPLSRDAVYAGYPYPLALAHNRVAITEAHARELGASLEARLRRAGGAAAARLVVDFHAVLDGNVP
jgi:hypothetical protein